MGKLIYLITTSLDGYIADEQGNFDWGMPSEEVHQFVNDTVRNCGTWLLGRKMYETMKVWDDMPDGSSDAMNDYAKIWQGTNKIVYSTTLSDISIANATLEQG